MLVTSHVLAGRLIGRVLHRHPLAGFAVGVVSHLAMDACPHWGTEKDAPGSYEEFLRVARIDGVAGLAAVAASVASARPDARRGVVAAVAGAALLDLDKPCMHFFHVNPFPQWCQWIHKQVQREAPHRLGYEMLVALGLAATMLLERSRSLPS